LHQSILTPIAYFSGIFTPGVNFRQAAEKIANFSSPRSKNISCNVLIYKSKKYILGEEQAQKKENIMSHLVLDPWGEQQQSDNQPSRALMAEHPEPPRVVRLVPSQRFPQLLAHEQIVQSTNLHESIDLCSECFAYDRNEIAIAQITMREDLTVTINAQVFQLTEPAYHDLCTILAIPITFSYAIPTALTALIIERLKQLHAQTVIVVARGTTIISFIDPTKGARGRGKSVPERLKKRPVDLHVRHIALLQMLERVWNGAAVDVRVTLADRGMQVAILQQDEAFAIEPAVGDITRLGLAVLNSESGGPLPTGRAYALRLLCKNGATLQHDFGHVHFSADWRCTLERRLNQFATELQALTEAMRHQCGHMQTAYTRMAHEYLDDTFFRHLYRRAQYHFQGTASSSDHIDRLFGVGPDQRREIVACVRNRERARRAANTGAIEAPRPTTLRAWDVFNNLSAGARDELHYGRRTALQNLAGTVVHAYLPPPN
jgi:hypothetical protein